MPVPVKAPRSSVFEYFEPLLVMPIEQFIGNAARRPFVGQLQSLGAKPLYADHRDRLVGQNASDCGGRSEGFQAGHVFRGMPADFIGKASPVHVLPNSREYLSIVSIKRSGIIRTALWKLSE